jgi:protease I
MPQLPRLGMIFQYSFYTSIEKIMNKIKVAVLVTDGFEQSEFEEPVKALKKANVQVDVISLKKGTIKAWKNGNWGEKVKVNKTVKNAKAKNYDALLLPGGVMNPDKLRRDKNAVDFVKGFYTSNKPIAAICHGPWTLAEAGITRGMRMTSFPSIKTDLINSGARWINKKVVTDKWLTTSRDPADLPAFCKRIVKEFLK